MTRSRTGCANCKRRKRKCDEAQPECRACVQRGLKCEGYLQPLRWNVGIASRGRLAGARAPEQATSSAPTRTAASHQAGEAAAQSTGVSTFSASDSPQDRVLDSLSSAWSSSSTSAAAPSPETQPVTQLQLFNQFLTSGLLRLYTTEAQTWIQPQFRVFSEQSEAFVHVCAAIQGYLNDRQRGLSLRSMEYVDNALQTFRTELASRSRTMHNATACAGLLFCTLLALQGRPWTFQLHLMADLYQLPATIPELNPGPEHNEATLHVLEVMGVMDLPSFVVGRTHSIGIWKRLRDCQETWTSGRRGGVEIVTGLPRSLLDVFSGIMDNDKEYTEARFLNWPGDLGNYLQCQLWDSWRFSGVLEVRRRYRCRRRKASRPAALSSILESTSRAEDDPSSEIVMCKLMASMDALFRAVDLPRNTHLLVRNGLIYPLITAGVEVDQLRKHPEWKVTIDEIREYFMLRDDFNLIKVTFDLIDEAWEQNSEYFDLDEAAQRRGAEVALF